MATIGPLLQQRRFDEARPLLETLLQLQPEHPEDLYNLGEVAFQAGNVEAAAGWYEKSAAADPSWESPVFKLALVALNRGDIEAAKALFQKVVDLAPDSQEGAQAKATIAALP